MNSIKMSKNTVTTTFTFRIKRFQIFLHGMSKTKLVTLYIIRNVLFINTRINGTERQGMEWNR